MSRPLFSVIIPSYNRRETLRRVLAAYEQQEPMELTFEVVVLDDGSTDGTLELLTSWRPRRYVLRFARQPNSGPAAARNRALTMARGELILFTGDDIEPTRRLLAEHWRAHQIRHAPEAVILGLTRWHPRAELTATMRHIDGPGAQQFSYYYLKNGDEYDFRHFYTSNVSIQRATLDLEPSYFSTDFPAAAFEDAELAYRLSLHGTRIFYHAAPVAYHHHQLTAESFFRRQVRCGAMAAVLYRKWPELEKWIGTRELAWLRLRALATDRQEPNNRSRLDAALPDWERRAINMAAFFDPLEAPVDAWLLALFEYAVRKGLAEALYSEDIARSVCSNLYLNIFPAALNRFTTELTGSGWILPRADALAIQSLVSEPSSV